MPDAPALIKELGTLKGDREELEIIPGAESLKNVNTVPEHILVLSDSLKEGMLKDSTKTAEEKKPSDPVNEVTPDIAKEAEETA